jgi:predicted dehydrogenase
MGRRFLILGGGSMGKRRIRCLLANRVAPEDIRVVDVRGDRREEIQGKYGVAGVASLDPGLAWNPAAVFVSVPGALHVTMCQAAAAAGKHIFCEVPLSVNLDGLAELAARVDEKRLLLAPGCQPPFHPLYRQLKEWLAAPDFGRLLLGVEVFGQYLPDWHPYEDYRTFYGASQQLGGCNLDVVAQQATVLNWLLDDAAVEVFCRAHRLSSLEIDGYDSLQLLTRTRRGAALTQQYDLIQRAGHHSLRLISETATLEYNPGAGTVRRYRAATQTWETVAKPEGFQYEQCYIDETALFLECLDGKAQWHVPLATATGVVRFLVAMLESATRGEVVRVDA